MPSNAVCPSLKARGICTDNGCTFNHEMHICPDCNIVYTSKAEYASHIKSNQHKKRLNVLADPIVVRTCVICNKSITGKQSHWNTHIRGSKHRKKASTKGVDPMCVPGDVQDYYPTSQHSKHCVTCDKLIPNHHWSLHLATSGHRIREQSAALKAALDEAEKDKHGVSISGETDLGVLEPAESNAGRTISLTISTTVPSARIAVIDAKLSSTRNQMPSTSFRLDVGSRSISYGKPSTITVTFRESNHGQFTDRVEVILQDTVLNKSFFIARSLRAIVGSREDHDLLRPLAPYVPRTRTQRAPETEVIPGERPPALKVIPWVVDLPEAAIPPHMLNALTHGSPETVVKSMRKTHLPAVLDGNSYGWHFGMLVWSEEYKMERDLEIYDIAVATLHRHESFYYLEVPGLAEKRPSVLVGDRILVQKHGDPRGKWYEGRVHRVREKEVGLRFGKSFSWSTTQRYSVRFKLNRFPVRRQHQALDTAFHPGRILFPSATHTAGAAVPSVKAMKLQIYNKDIAQNPPQLQAVTSIVNQKPGATPFAIFGPPGTGKTVTVREAIRQILRTSPTAHILACAPSNSAADLIAQGLLDLSPDELFRFYAPSRKANQVPEDLKPYISMFGLAKGGTDSYVSNYDLHFTVPPMARLRRFRVIVSTCVSAAMPYGVGLPRGHFSHIFIDEAGQATEPEVMIPIKTMADNATNVVLSGDHKQLGPIIRSAVARELGLEKSFLERLMEREEYDELGGHGRTVVKLVKNFRSHKSILAFPNERFYKGELQPCGDPGTINAVIGSALLPSKNFPIIFHAISGQDMREASSPSFFNIEEITLVREYVEKLRGNRQVRISDQDIGIIAPYHAQCQKLRTRLKNFADEVKVGSVEEFQGQERKVIILSTVRSSKEFVKYDLKHTLGFVANPRRFNVSVTRAKALLIIVGDPGVLSLDPLWRNFLNYVHANGGWKGAPPTWDTREDVNEAGGYDQQVRELALADINDFSRRIAALTLENADEEDDDGMEAGVDRPWRDVE